VRNAILVLLLAACGGSGGDWLVDPQIMVKGVGSTVTECRDMVCPHNENTDEINFDGAIYLVHRTAMSQVLGPNSSLRVYRSDDGGDTFDLLAIIPAPTDRDLRDPCFYIVNGNLTIKGLTRLAVNSSRDSNVDTITVATTSTDKGHTWSALTPIAPDMWSFWRVKENAGKYYAAAYEDGDLAVQLYESDDGATWTPGAQIYGVAADTPLETELVFMPSGKMLALVRMDGTDDELLGDTGRLRTAVCWADPPYASFSCPQVLDGQRLDGPVAFWHDSRLFVVAREHFLDTGDEKRTALYELGGTLEGGPLTITMIGEMPSAGDTAYAGYADIDKDHGEVTWYSSSIPDDEPWALAIFQAADIWKAKIDFTKL
jgi:hypothetical protein